MQLIYTSPDNQTFCGHGFCRQKSAWQPLRGALQACITTDLWLAGSCSLLLPVRLQLSLAHHLLHLNALTIDSFILTRLLPCRCCK